MKFPRNENPLIMKQSDWGPYKNSSKCKYCYNNPHIENPRTKENFTHLGGRYGEISRFWMI